MKKLLPVFLAFTFAIQPLLPFAPDVSALTEQQDLSEVTRNGPLVFYPKEPSALESLGIIEAGANETALYADLLTKNIKYNGTDRKWLKRLFDFSVDMEAKEVSTPGTIRAYANKGTIPDELRQKYSITKDHPMPVLDKELADLLRNLVTDEELTINDVTGAGHEYLDVARLWKDYDTSKKEENKEGVTVAAFEDLKSQIGSTHALDRGQALDIAAADYIRCTQVTYKASGKNKYKIKDKVKTTEKQPIPIEFSWQTQNPGVGASSGNAFLGGLSQKLNGALTPNALPSLGVSFDDLLSKIQDPINSVLGMLGNGGWSVNLKRLVPSIGAGFDPRNYQDVINATGEGVFRDLQAGSQYANTMPLGGTGSFSGTVDGIGAAIIQKQLLPNVPASIFAGNTMTDWGDAYARNQLGAAILGGGISLEGNTNAEIWRNLGYVYAIAKVFRLDPALGFTDLPFDTAQHTRESLGRLAVAERVGATLSALRDGNADTVRSAIRPALDMADITDQRLNLVDGTTARFNGGQLSPDQYFELVGQVVVERTVGAYPNDATVRRMAYGLGIYFAAPEDIFLPENSPARLTELQRFYRDGPVRLITDADWKDFSIFYTKLFAASALNTNTNFGGGKPFGSIVPPTGITNPALSALLKDVTGLTKEERENRLGQGLFAIIHDPTDYVGQLTTGSMNSDQWQQLGHLVFARALTTQPFQQLAFAAYLRDPDHAAWTTRVSVTKQGNPTQIISAPSLTFGTGGVGLTPTITGGQAVPVFSPELLMSVIGLSETDLTYITNDLFQVLVLPRLANDGFLEATDNGSPGDAFNGQSRTPSYDDEFLTTTLSAIKEQLPNQAKFSDLRQKISAVGPADWKGTPDSPRDEKVHLMVIDLGKRFMAIRADLSEGQRTEVRNLLASLAAGRHVGDIYNLETPARFVPDESIGLTQKLADDLYAGRVSPNQAKRTVGTQYLSNYFFDAADPKRFASDLTAAVNAPNQQAAANNFYTQYESTFSSLAQSFTSSLDFQGKDNFGGRQVYQVLSGNRLPLFALTGALLYEASTGAKGNIFGSSAGSYNQNTGMRALFDAAQLVGQLPSGSNSVKGVLTTILAQHAGITWADNPIDLIKQNPNLMENLGAPQDVIDKYHAAFALGDAANTLSMLKNVNWKDPLVGINVISSLGSTGQSVVDAFSTIFGNGQQTGAQGGGSTQNILKPIQDNIQQFIKAIPGGVTPGELANVWSAIQTNNTGALANTLAGIGSKIGGANVGNFASLAATIAGGNASPAAILSQSISAIGKLYKLDNIEQFTGVVGALQGFFTGGTVGLAGIAGAAATLATAFKIPMAGDVARMVSDPKGFGMALIAKKMSDYYGVDYGVTRQALMGLASGDYMSAGKAVVSKVLSDSDMAKSLDEFLPGAKDKIIGALVSNDIKGSVLAVGQSLAYAGLDKTTGFKPGFAQAMVAGTGEQKLNALLDNSDKLWPDMPPEGNIAIDLIKSKGDISQISSSTWAFLDGKAGDALGMQVPPGFMQGAAGVISGKTSFQDFAIGIGANYLTAAISDKIKLPTAIPGGNGTGPIGPGNGLVVQAGLAFVGSALDNKMGLPPGTSGAIGQAGLQIASASNALANAQGNLLLNKFDPRAYDAAVGQARANLAGAYGAGAAMLVNMVFGKEIAQFEQSLGLPPGIVSTFMQAGFSSLFGGAAFATALSTAFIPFAAMFIAGKLFAALGIEIPLLGGLLGGEDKTVTQVVCSAAGYYPYIKPDEDKDENGDPKAAVYDPNENLDKYKPLAERKKPKEVAKELGLWAGYPGEFLGEEGIPEKDATTFEIAKKATARWKIRQVLGEFLSAPEHFGEGTATGVSPDYQFRQIIAFQLPQTDLSSDKQFPSDGDYLLPYDSRFSDSTFTVTDQKDPRYKQGNYYKQKKGDPADEQDLRFVHTNGDGQKVGIIDWLAQPLTRVYTDYTGDASQPLGYGTDTPGSMWAEQQKSPGEYNWGVWLEKSADFSAYIHASF